MGRPGYRNLNKPMSGAILPTDRVQDARYQLRSGTHGEHVRLNQHPMLVGLTRPDYPIPRYRMLMAAYYHFYSAVEDGIEQFGDEVFQYSPRRKLPWLLEDLAYLETDPLATENLPLQALPDMTPADVPELAGMLYTIEGSTLGGRVISRHLSTHLGLSPDRGGRFFSAYSHLTDHRWHQFESFLNATLVTDVMVECAVNAARRTFALIETILDDFHERVR